ncbi:MAG: phosphatase PAP2 family protein [Actinomycetota bacterium]
MAGDPVIARRLAGVAAVVTVLLAVVVSRGHDVPGELRLLRTITDAAGTGSDDAARVVGDLTDPLPIIAVTAVVAAVLVARDRRRSAGLLVVVVAVALAANPWWKDLVDRPRPDVRVIPEPVSPLAFPAGHAAATAALAGGLLLAAPRQALAPVAVAGAGLLTVTAWSRLVTGAHHPSDLVAGWLWVGALVIALWPHREPR